MRLLKHHLLTLALLLPLGLVAQEYIELNLPKSNKVVIRVMFKNGSICDPAGKEGLTALTADLISDGGTGEWSKSDIDNMIFPMAAYYGASVDKQVSVFTFEFPAVFTDDFYPILKGLLLNPSFDENDFNRIKSSQLNYVTRSIRNSSDETYSKLALEDFLFRGGNYQHMVSGTEAGVNAITLDDAKQQYKKYFTKDNVWIGIAGNYSPEFLQQLKADIATLPALEVEVPDADQAKMPDGIEVEIISKPGAFGSAIYGGFPIDITRSKDEFAALMIANSYMGEHRKSYGRLYQEIREYRSMNYGDYTYIEWYPSGSSNMLPVSGYPRQANYFSLWIRPVQTGSGLKQQYDELKDITLGHAHFAIRLAFLELDKLIKEGMSQEDFELTKTFLRSYIKLYIKSPGEQLGYLMDSRFYGRKDFISEVDQLLAKTTLEDVNNAVRKYLQIENMRITIITSPDEAEPLAESLRKNLKSPMSYSNVVKEGLEEEIFEKDRMVEVFPLNVKEVKIIDTQDTFK